MNAFFVEIHIFMEYLKGIIRILYVANNWYEMSSTNNIGLVGVNKPHIVSALHTDNFCSIIFHFYIPYWLLEESIFREWTYWRYISLQKTICCIHFTFVGRINQKRSETAETFILNRIVKNRLFRWSSFMNFITYLIIAWVNFKG